MNKTLEESLKEKIVKFIETNFEPESTFIEFDKKLKEKFKIREYWEASIDIKHNFLCDKKDYSLVCYSLEPSRMTIGIMPNDSAKIYGFFSAKIVLTDKYEN